YQLQNGGWILGIVAALATAAFIAVRGPDALLGRERVTSRLWQRRELAVVRHIGIAALLTVGLAGVITPPTHWLLIFAALALAKPVAWVVVDRLGLGRITERLPTLLRVGLAVGVSFGVAFVITPRLYTPNDQDYFSVIAGLIPALFAIEL